MARRWTNTLTSADVTPKAAFLNRRQIMAGIGGMAGLAGIGGLPQAAQAETLEPNSWEDVTTYCNYYEFGTGKGDPAKYAGQLTTSPWSVKIDGLVDRPGDYDFQQILGEMTWRNASTAFAVLRPGQWWCPGPGLSWQTC
jgi:sulfoxide reductase catalytic subunit YedY